jgi:hypothetical protein
MMRSSIVFRLVSVVIIVTALIVGVIVPVAAQEVTAEATEAFTSEMMAMDSSCPQNVVSTLVEQLTTMQTDATEEAPAVDATEEAPAMEATEEAPVMEATEESADVTAEPVTGPLCLVGSLMGSAEVPGPGDEDGLGLAFVTFDSTTGEVCYEVAVANIELPAQAMHIHAAEAGVSGGVVIPFPTAPNEEGVAMGCTTAEDMAILADLAANPAGYYVNVHTTDFPDGAVRAQLMTLEDGHLMMEDMGLQLFDMRGDTADATPEATPAQ